MIARRREPMSEPKRGEHDEICLMTKPLCVHWSDPEPLNIAAGIAQIKAQKIDGDSNEKCPICEYKISGCQCRYGGSAHPDRNDKRRVVFDHLHLLSLTQLQHVISLEKYWQISYSDADLNAILKRLIANSQCEGGENG